MSKSSRSHGPAHLFQRDACNPSFLRSCKNRKAAETRSISAILHYEGLGSFTKWVERSDNRYNSSTFEHCVDDI